MIRIHPIKAFKDNYIWLIQFSDHQAVVVDPGDPTPVQRTLDSLGLELSAILVTHGHWDHVDGIEILLKHHNVPVYGSGKERVPGRTHAVNDGQIITLGEASLQVMEVPGHTNGHISYYGAGALFCGDTLFGAGCGRLLGGSIEELHRSLSRIKKLPGETLNHCAHEYTEANLRFALAIDPGNTALQQRTRDTRELRQQGQPSIPSTLALENETNPFLRCHIPQIIESAEKHCGHALNSEFEVFKVLRAWKDNFS